MGANALIVNEAPKTDYGKAVYAVIIGVAFAFIIYIVNIPGILTSKTIINAFKMAGAGNAQGALIYSKSHRLQFFRQYGGEGTSFQFRHAGLWQSQFGADIKR